MSLTMRAPAAMAAVLLLLSHALFKSALFLIVGIVDKNRRHPRRVGPRPR